jgi:pimeloyl-ACP methyl ester carboxylesterase
MGLAPEQIDAMVVQLEAAFAPATEAWVRTMFPENADPELVDRVARDMAAAPPEVATAVLRESLSWYSEQAPRLLAELKCPLHAINADRIPTQREALSELVDGYELRLMPGRGHFLALEDPATFTRLLSESLATLEVRSGTL